MATITLSNPCFYYDGQAVTDPWVGFTSTNYRIVRYEFIAPNGGANKVQLEITQTLYLSGSNAEHHDFCFYIGTSSSSHAQANSDSPYIGRLTMTRANDGTSYSTFSGEADVSLNPNTKYYVWIFSNSAAYSGRYTNYSFGAAIATITTTGAAGLVHIRNGNSLESYQVYIKNGSACNLYMPYIKVNGALVLFGG